MSYSQNIGFKIFIKVHKSFNVQFSSYIKIFIKVQVFHQSSSFSSKFKFFIKIQVFHQSSSFSSKFKFFIKVQVFHQSSGFSSKFKKFTKCWFQILISNVDFKKCQFLKGFLFVPPPPANIGTSISQQIFIWPSWQDCHGLLHL